ncbi:endonuclease domain-containing protein [Novosphingobium piscinae]|uniref:DUF559 domain-containing protein n=1 Tax=Novosphingobium piscinae TaxID=1507448 RepID=A0A7X1KRB2_9SPHN|nr:DUF559 domain-containing protein [Novosphingobium piscinae]MBC2670557.1 DUF559 domain-containing protein [Novosphingobium piscinae]
MTKRTLTIRADAPSALPRQDSWTPSPERAERLKERARTLRRELSEAETALWDKLSGARLGGIKFTRKAVVGSVIVDFACPSRWVVVSLSGEGANPELDALQDRKLTEAGIRVLRFTDDEVLTDIDRVTKEIATLVHTPFDRPGRPAPQRRTQPPRGRA